MAEGFLAKMARQTPRGIRVKSQGAVAAAGGLRARMPTHACPRCGATTALRASGRGPNAGKRLW